MSQSIVIVTSAQPSANPRAVKEAIALSEAGYKVAVVYCPLSPWTDDFDKILFSQYPEIQWVQAGYHSCKQSFLYKYARLRRKLYEVLYKSKRSSNKNFERALILFSQELYNKALTLPADIYIGHNLGALPVVVKLAKKKKVKVGFDAEDFHSGELSPHTFQHQLAVRCEEHYLSQLDYLTTSSPLISEKYQVTYNLKPPVTVINTFSKKNMAEKLEPYKIGDILKLFWFSQVVAKNRGVEDVIAAMGICSKNGINIQLSLMGNCTREMKDFFFQLVKNAGLKIEQINFINPKPVEEIFAVASQHHIGLALESVSNINRQLCLTNKILSYPLAGLAIIATSTLAQNDLFTKYDGMGVVYEDGNIGALSSLLNQYSTHESLVNTHRGKALAYAAGTLNWEYEQKNLLAVIRSQFN